MQCERLPGAIDAISFARASAHTRSVTSRMQYPIRPVGLCHGCIDTFYFCSYMHIGILCHASCVVQYPEISIGQGTPADDRRSNREEGQTLQTMCAATAPITGAHISVGHPGRHRPREQLRCDAIAQYRFRRLCYPRRAHHQPPRSSLENP